MAIFCLAFLSYGCSTKTDAEGGEEMAAEAGHEGHEEPAHEKMVHLNEAQYKNAGIDTGWFEMKNLSEVINANGYTKLPPQNQAEVSVQLPGTIQSIKVMEGEYVKKGQILATLQSMAYNNMRLEREKLVQDLHASEANVEYLQLEYARQMELSAENVTAKKVIQKVRTDLKAEESKVKALTNQITIIGQNISMGGSTASSIINIVSPINGNVIDIDVTIGSSAEEGKPLFHIVDNSQMHVDLLVYEKDLFKVKSGQQVRFILTNQNNMEIGGKIFGVGKAFENDTKAVAVHATIDDNKMLIPGMYVNALIDIGASKVNALPIEAIIKAEGKEFIFVLEKISAEHGDEGHVHQEGEAAHKEEGHVQKVGEAAHAEGEEEHSDQIAFARIEVKTGPAQLGYIQVTPLVEIHKGDRIVIKGGYYLQSHLMKSEGGGGGHAH